MKNAQNTKAKGSLKQDLQGMLAGLPQQERRYLVAGRERR